ncbi:MAG: PAS domain-containing protein, partial [Candidatus Marinimicrobia bacterium]|nr:PAS domain-containing protein [Candidatus Neomarinimicrobiota bacterium]
RPCLADLLVEGNIKNLPEWYSDKYQKSHLVENGFEATEFFPNLGKDGKWLFFTAVAIKNSKGEIIGSLETLEDITESKRAEEQREKFIAELQEALDKIKTLKGLIPICACCKKIRDDQGYWNSVESYIKDHAEVEFTHGICPDCMKKLYPNYCKDDNDKKEA